MSTDTARVQDGADRQPVPSRALRHPLGEINPNVQLPAIPAVSPDVQYTSSCLHEPHHPSTEAPRECTLNMKQSKRHHRVPEYVKHTELTLQTPAEGPFSVDDLNWVNVVVHEPHRALVAAIPPDRLDDFVEGEGSRGWCQVRAKSQGTSDSLSVNKRCFCMFGAPDHAIQKQRQLLKGSAEPLPAKSGGKGRCAANHKGTSQKKGCQHRFGATLYRDVPDKLFIRFPCQRDDTVQTCAAMKHSTNSGLDTHADESCERHLREYQADIEELAVQLLRTNTKPAAIITSMFPASFHSIRYHELCLCCHISQQCDHSCCLCIWCSSLQTVPTL